MEDKDLRNEEFPSNSKKPKPAAAPQNKPEEKKVEKVVTGVVKTQKKGIGKKMADLFIEDDTKSVGSYIFHDVLIPAAKSMICDMVGWGGMAEMILFGGRKGNRTTRDRGRSYVNYNSVSYNSSSNRDTRDRDRREISKVGRSRHDFDEIVLETRGEAEEVLSHLVDLTIDYDMASVSDLYDLVGIESNYTDEKYGWTDLRSASISRVRGGYLINLPRTQPLD